MKDALKRAGGTAAGMLPAVLLAQRGGMPALVAVVFLAVLVLGVTCWVIGNSERSDRVTRMMLARRGDARCLEPGTLTPPSPASWALPGDG